MEPIPRYLQVGPHRYRIVVDAGAASELSVDLGETSTVLARIVVHPGQARTQLRDTLLHEALHALLDTAGLTAPGTYLTLHDHDDQERLIASLSPLLLDTLRRNPALLTFLLEDA